MSIDWETLDVKSAAEMLAKTQLAARALQPLTKQALGAGVLGALIGKPLRAAWNDPKLKYVARPAILGAAGAGIGAAGFEMGQHTMADTEEKQQRIIKLKDALALMAGAGLGGAALGAIYTSGHSAGQKVAEHTKQANPLAGMALPDFAGMASQAGQWLQSMLPQDPAARDIATKALIGAGAGGLGGLGLGVMSDRKKNPLTTALTGALGGGMVGAGLGGLTQGAKAVADTSQQIQQQGQQAAQTDWDAKGPTRQLVDVAASKLPWVEAKPGVDMPAASDLLAPAAKETGGGLLGLLNPGGAAGAVGGAMSSDLSHVNSFKSIDRTQLNSGAPYAALKPVVHKIDDAFGGPGGSAQAAWRLGQLQRNPAGFVKAHGIELDGITPRAAAGQMRMAAGAPTWRGRALRGGIGGLLGNLIWNATGADSALNNYLSGESAQ